MNVYLANNINPVVQAAESNTGNYRVNNKNLNGNEIIQSDYSEDASETQKHLSLSINQNTAITSTAIGESVELIARSFSSSGFSSLSKLRKHNFAKKIKRFEHHMFAKRGGHKKSKHLVDVCFNWKN